MSQKLQKRYGLITAIAMVVGIVIGSGVFFKAQTILELTGGNLLQGIMAWLIGGAVMLCCILAFAIMAGKYEKVNGIVDYAHATVSSGYSYAVGWFMTVVYYPTLVSVLAWLSARYTLVFITNVFNIRLSIPNNENGCSISPECIALALFYLCAAYAVNSLAPKIAGYFQVTATFIKLIPLVVLAVIGTIVGLFFGDHTLVENFSTHSAELTYRFNPVFAAIVSTAFAYEGWIIATAINAELKNSKRNLPLALVIGGCIIIAVYIAYFIGVAGGASSSELIEHGATLAFTNLFGNYFGNVLNLFVAISCLGTLNGLMLGCTRGMYSLAVRGKGPRSSVFSSVDDATNMPANSSIIGLLLCACWFAYFYFSNLAQHNWFGFFGFDSSELPIVTLYALYIPIFVMFMIRCKEEKSMLRRFFIPTLAIAGSLFMIAAAVYSHGLIPYVMAAEAGEFACPIAAYLIVFAVIMAACLPFRKSVKGVK